MKLLDISTVKFTKMLTHCSSNEFESKEWTLKITTVLVEQKRKKNLVKNNNKTLSISQLIFIDTFGDRLTQAVGATIHIKVSY